MLTEINSTFIHPSRRPVTPQRKIASALDTKCDQWQPAHKLFCYPANDHSSIALHPDALDASLSIVLDAYPHLAGSQTNGPVDECGGRARVVTEWGTVDDPGMVFVVAQHSQALDDILPKPVAPGITDSTLIASAVDLHPAKAQGFDMEGAEPISGVKVTTFACGGVTIGISVKHCLFDAQALVLFANDWALVHRTMTSGGEPAVPIRPYEPEAMDALAIAAPSQYENKDDPILQEEMTVAGQFECAYYTILFSPEEVEWIYRAAEPENGGRPRPSHLDAVTAHMWRLVLDTKERCDPTENLGLVVACDLRQRGGLPPTWLGSPTLLCVTSLPSSQVSAPSALPTVARKVRSLISPWDRASVGAYSHRLQQVPDPGLEGVLPFGEKITYTVSWISISGYDVDFGAGRPVLAYNLHGMIDGLVSFLDRPTAEADASKWYHNHLEVRVCLRPERMARLVANPALRNPSLL